MKDDAFLLSRSSFHCSHLHLCLGFSAPASFSLFHHIFRALVFFCAPLRVGRSPSPCAFVKSDTRPARTLPPTPALKHLHAASAHFLAKSIGGTRCVTKEERRGRRTRRSRRRARSWRLLPAACTQKGLRAKMTRRGRNFSRTCRD